MKPSALNVNELSDLLARLACECEELGTKLVDAESEYRFLEDMEKISLDSNMPTAEGSIRDREREARISDGYVAHIYAVRDARKAYLQALYNYKDKVRKHDDINSILLKRFISSGNT